MELALLVVDLGLGATRATGSCDARDGLNPLVQLDPLVAEQGSHLVKWAIAHR